MSNKDKAIEDEDIISSQMKLLSGKIEICGKRLQNKRERERERDVGYLINMKD